MNVAEIAILNFPHIPRKRIKFYFRVFLYGRKCLTKLENIFNHPKLQRIIIEYPSLYTKIFLPYHYKGLQIQDRIVSIKNHHDFIKKYWSSKLINAVYLEKSFLLAKLNFDDQTFSIVFEPTCKTRYESEGELLLSLYAHEKIISLCFNFTTDKNGDSGIFISSMQGSSNKNFMDLNDVIKNFTKKTGGMRPQMFLLHALTVIAFCYDVKKIMALKNESHIKSKRIKADTDSFWIDFGGKSFNKISYLLPLVYQRKSMEEIKTNKRAMYKNRYKVLDLVEEQIKSRL